MDVRRKLKMKVMEKIRPYVVALGIGAMALSGCGKSESERFSTPEASVYKPAGLKDTQFSHVDFKDFGDRDDATLGVEPDGKGGFNLYVGVKYEHTKTDVIMRNGEVIDTRRDGGTRSGALKQFRDHSPNRESLDSDVQALLTGAREYAGSRQYHDDLERALKPTERQQGDQ